MMLSEYCGCSNNRGVEGGDDIEAICIDDPRFDADKLTQDLPLAQIDRAIRLREPIKHLMLSKQTGNHEDRLWKFGDITAHICAKLGVDYGTFTAKISIIDLNGLPMYKIYDTHGRRGVSSSADDPIRREANMKLSLKRSLVRKAGDCAVMIKHHTHKLLVCEPHYELYLTDDGKHIYQGYTGVIQQGDYIDPDARWYGNAGSFLKLYGEGTSGYAEKAEYDPAELGFLILRVRERKIVGLDAYKITI